MKNNLPKKLFPFVFFSHECILKIPLGNFHNYSVLFLTLHGTQPESLCKKLWSLWNSRKSIVEESIDYFDPRHKYWLQVSVYF